MKFNDDQLKEIFKDCNVITDFKFDSENGIITINKSDPLISVTEIKIEKKEGQKYSEVTLKFDANVTVNGRMLLESMICNNKMEKINNLLHE
ncbi:hypothetical protein [Clostridium cadaveris]|uniref:hypothetical protein n=1 Tax=Clostridium cadaveris TaxID=1529 RepID=UPI0004121FBA|nr:hypothetical protein [Clostridium cadaveris]NME64420.1 hypothetical protein [Clostridium cadaveris]